MSGRPAITWGDIARVCREKGIAISQGKGGELKLKGPSGGGMVRVQTIGHQWCKSKGTTVPRPLVGAFKRNFGVTDDDLFGS